MESAIVTLKERIDFLIAELRMWKKQEIDNYDLEKEIQNELDEHIKALKIIENFKKNE